MKRLSSRAIPRIGGLLYALALILACAFVYAEREPEPERERAVATAPPVVPAPYYAEDGRPRTVEPHDWGSGED